LLRSTRNSTRRAPEFDEAVDKADRRKGLAAAGRHLDQRTRAVVEERPFEVRDRFDLSIPQTRGDERWHVSQTYAERHGLCRPLGQRFGPVKGKHAAAARVRIKSIGEERFDAGAFVEEWQRRMPRRRNGGQAHAVFRGLRFDAAQGRAFGLGLDRADDAPVNKQRVIGEASLERELAHGHAAPRAQVQLAVMLYLLATGIEELVNILTSACFRRVHGLFLCSDNASGCVAYSIIAHKNWET
jgi:hypothetical protein